MQSIVIKGNLTRDPEFKTITKDGNSVDVVNFTVAETRKFTRKNGTKDEETTFINCESWESGARLINQLMSKGDPILVQGTLKLDKWEKDGVKHQQLKLRVSNFDKLYRKSNSDSNGTDAVSEPTSEPVAVGSNAGEIPF